MKLFGKVQILVITIFVIMLIVLYVLLVPGSPNKAMQELSLGRSYQDLLAMAGPPSYETDGSKWVEPEHEKSLDQLIEGCERELWYENWRGLMPSKFSFCFDSEGKLIHKYHWSSW